MTIEELFKTRDVYYSDWSDKQLVCDARTDLLRYLNCLTDKEWYSKSDLEDIHCIVDTIGHLNVDYDTNTDISESASENSPKKTTKDEPQWVKKYPEFYNAFKELKSSFNDFMTTKANNGDGAVHLEKALNAHNTLTKLVKTSPNVTDNERATIANFIAISSY